MNIDVIGVGMHPFGRFPESSMRDMARIAAISAILDADLEVKDIQAAYVSNSLGGALVGQNMIRGQTVLRDIGIGGIPVVNVENACAGGGTALREAVLAVRSGAVDCALALGVEKMYVGDRDRTLDALQSAGDLEIIGKLGLQFTAVYAMRLRERLDRGELELHHLVDVTVKAHRNGARNPNAQFRKEVTPEEILNSAKIAEPLTLLMCSAIGDGAAAVIVAKSGTTPETGRPTVRIKASALAMGWTGAAHEMHTAEACARLAYEEAGVGPEDIGVFEVHDAMAPGELLYYEELGLCGPGEAGALLDKGVTALEGEHAVNPSGGLSARGHPIGATGLAQVAELTWQMRGEAGDRQVSDCRFALAQNSGGWLEGESAACTVHILERSAR